MDKATATRYSAEFHDLFMDGRYGYPGGRILGRLTTEEMQKLGYSVSDTPKPSQDKVKEPESDKSQDKPVSQTGDDPKSEKDISSSGIMYSAAPPPGYRYKVQSGIPDVPLTLVYDGVSVVVRPLMHFALSLVYILNEYGSDDVNKHMEQRYSCTRSIARDVIPMALKYITYEASDESTPVSRVLSRNPDSDIRKIKTETNAINKWSTLSWDSVPKQAEFDDEYQRRRTLAGSNKTRLQVLDDWKGKSQRLFSSYEYKLKGDTKFPKDNVSKVTKFF